MIAEGDQQDARHSEFPSETETPAMSQARQSAYGGNMQTRLATLCSANTSTPIGPYNHITKVGQVITIGGTAGVDPATGQLAGADVYAQTTQILKSFKIMLEEVDSDLDHVMHINVFLKNMSDFDQMNTGYTAAMGTHRPARTVVGVNELPKTRCPAHDEAYRGDKDEDRG
jgi:2-iminobutanoate/2-iminopropanoate deaminase